MKHLKQNSLSYTFYRHQKEDHFDEYHAPVICQCGESVEKRLIDSHRADFCRKRQKQCCYCELSLDFEQFEAHVEFCGSRTDLCTKCSRYIKLKDFSRHEDSGCAFPEVVARVEPKPVVNSKRTVILRQAYQTRSPSFEEERPDSARSLDTKYLNQFVRETSRMSLSMLPCEFCFENFTSHELLKHQVSLFVNFYWFRFFRCYLLYGLYKLLKNLKIFR